MTLEPSLFHACELWRLRAVKAEAIRDELLIRIRDLEQQLAEARRWQSLAGEDFHKARELEKRLLIAEAAIAKAKGRLP